MKEKVKEKNVKKLVIAIMTLSVVTVIVFYFGIYNPLKKYKDTHTWATIRITGTVESDTSDAYEESAEFLKGDTYHLHNTTVTIEDITTAGEVTLRFEPAVIQLTTGETVSEVVIGKDDIFGFEEVCSDGASAQWQFRVISNRYQ